MSYYQGNNTVFSQRRNLFIVFSLFKLHFKFKLFCRVVADFVIKKLEQKKSPLDFN